MPYRNMTLEELAQHIGMDAREVRRLAEKGVLPGQLVGGRWRFNRAEMLDWLQREMHGLSPEAIHRLEIAMTDGVTDDAWIASLMPLSGVELLLPARSKASVLRELVALAVRTGLVVDRAALVAALEERETLGSTALAGGLALPHPRRPMPEATDQPLVCFGRVPAGLPFGAPDGRLTDLFFLVLSHDDRGHLRVLARLAQLLSSKLPAELRDAESAEDALTLIQAQEKTLLADRDL
ncbi:MAG: PTS sugar transporter subunit IIA [Planctomycetes bacterium]|nr:PTS sugar transporter subunit IIA [Planctomycetota bacterium]